MSSTPLNAGHFSLVERIAAIVGPQGVITKPEEIAPYVIDWRRAYQGATSMVVRPANTEEVAAVVKACAESNTPIVPQGGNTGLCGGAVPRANGRELVLSLSRMNRVRATDLENDTITVEAGCILANIQQAASDANRLFPLSLAAEGSCQIGGNLSTNAGGVAVLRYGNARDLTLGLEVVLPNGQIWNGLRGLRKDNSGYDMKDLFIGAEGTLGIITAAVLKLFPKPKKTVTAFVAVPDAQAAVALLSLVRNQCGDRLTGFEFMSRICIDLVLTHISGSHDPLFNPYPWYVLMELTDTLAISRLEEALEETLTEAIEIGLAHDAVVAVSESQAKALWALRENIPEAQRIEGVSIKHDVSVPVSRIPELIQKAESALTNAFPGIRIVTFGHIGDGNLHYNCSKPNAADNNALLAIQSEVNRVVYDVVTSLNGSISAEHGLGQLKREEITRYKSAIELELMRSIKRALDPNGLMNPGKVL
ncbi:MAG TPA: FAD-binding oxidoreductase [Burkholderiales bacterium]|nr:FAD-binding oxidoreductase [Burkholderiales bacterium]